MPSSTQYLAGLRKLPEIQVLLRCAERCQIRFGLRGGILRNALLGDVASENPPQSLYDFVDPFSDIDLIVESEQDWAVLSRALTSSLPFAGFHRWEADTHEAVRIGANRYETIPVDRLILWFDASKGKDLVLDGLGVDPGKVLEQPILMPEFNPLVVENPFENLLGLLRTARYALAYPRHRSDIEPSFLFREWHLGPALRQYRLGKEETISPELWRLEVAILDLLFTGQRWKELASFLELCRREIPLAWIDRSRLLRAIFSPNLYGSRVGAVIYKPGPRSSMRARFLSETGPTTKNLPDSIIPWTTLWSSGFQGDSCCPYRDFQNGVAAIAWRETTDQGSYSDLKESNYSVVAAALPRKTPYPAASHFKEASILPLPGFVRAGQTLVIRADHGFVRELIGKNTRFLLGLIPSKEA